MSSAVLSLIDRQSSRDRLLPFPKIIQAIAVLNPAAVRAHDGQLYLFPRLVARGNYSRIGIVRRLRYGLVSTMSVFH